MEPAGNPYKARRDQIAGSPAPQRAGDADDVPARVADVRDTDDVYRLYTPQWLIVYAGNDEANCWAYAEAEYSGRIPAEDMRVECTSAGVAEQERPVYEVWHLYLRVPLMWGEFKHADVAQRSAEEQGLVDYEIVTRNSRRDHEIRSYGITKLP